MKTTFPDNFRSYLHFGEERWFQCLLTGRQLQVTPQNPYLWGFLWAKHGTNRFKICKSFGCEIVTNFCAWLQLLLANSNAFNRILTLLVSHTADVAQDLSQWVSRAWPKNCCRGLDHESSWVMTWPLLLFNCVVFTWLYPAGLVHFEVSQNVIFELSQCLPWLMAPANHSTTMLMNLCELIIQTWTAYRYQMRRLSWLNMFEPILDQIIPMSGRKKENAKSQFDQWKSGMDKILEEKIRHV